MKKIVLLAAICIFFQGMLFAENDTTEVNNWKYEGFFSQQLNQVSFSHWVAGGENSFASTSVANLGAEYQKERITWENRLEMAYGIIKLEDSPTRKNEDRIDLLSKFGRTVSPNLSTSALLNFRSQFDKGFDYPNDSVVVSRFMAPGYLILALGMDYKPWESLSIFFSPATGKFTFVRDQDLADRGAYGVEPAEFDEEGNKISDGSNVKSEFGAMLGITFRREILENVRLSTRLELFNDYTDDKDQSWRYIDVNWKVNLNMKVNRYITATAGFHMIYDHDIPVPKVDEEGEEYFGRKVQLKQMFGVGLSYSF